MHLQDVIFPHWLQFAFQTFNRFNKEMTPIFRAAFELQTSSGPSAYTSISV